MFLTDDVIAAIASPAGNAARGIVRVSGPGVVACLECFRPHEEGVRLTELRVPTAIAGELSLASWASAAPGTLYLWPTDRSYTRQPLAELHTIGSPPLLEAVLAAVCAAGARLARPGEFTLRAFLAGRLDLTQAEAVLGVIDAADRRQLDVALSQLAGGLSRPLAALRDDLLNLLADIEAGLDFVDEDIQFVAGDEVLRRLSMGREAIAKLREQLGGRVTPSHLPRVVLAGAPNAGKSSLFNCLAGAAALVSPVAGTTRDYLAANVEWDGRRLQLIDTAGLADHSTGAIDAAAQEAAERLVAQADLTLACLDASGPLSNRVQRLRSDSTPPRIIVLTKCDRPLATWATAMQATSPIVQTSTRTGAGQSELRQAIVAALESAQNAESTVVQATAARCRESLCRAAESLERATALARQAAGDELIAGEIRLALDELGQIVGAIYTDDLLDRVFSRFCIGK